MSDRPKSAGMYCPKCALGVTHTHSITTNQCEHGQLRRQCEVCELIAELATARAFIEKRGHDETCKRRHHCKVCDKPHFSGYHDMGHPNASAHHRFVMGDCTCGYNEAMGDQK